MAGHWFAVFLLIPLPWNSEVGAVYHELSMSTFSPPPDVNSSSLFGYSIAYQPNSKKLITSAPKFGTGNIYECNIDTTKCEKIEVNITGDYINSDMWLGATVATSNNLTMACAPRYIEWKSRNNSTRLGTFGRCYSMTSGSVMSELPTLKQQAILTPYEKNMDSFGWSINVDNYNNVLVGGPAMNRGRVMLYDKSPDPKLLNTPHYRLKVNFNYGYSVTSGNFLSVDHTLYAISTPYGTMGKGMVILTDMSKNWALPEPQLLYRPAVGALFGAALAPATLRGPEQRQSLLVGAPRYAEKGRVDVGAVYIYQFNPAARQYQEIVHQKTILGKKDNGQFGSAVISLGDLNGDKRDEIAVAAPYEDSGKGAVYIYSADHLLSGVAENQLQSLQRIQPEGYRAFGLSLTAIRDYDDNGCNEIAIGAPHSDKFVVLKCMANFIVNVQKLQRLKNATHFVFESCMDLKFPEKPKTVKADILLKISISHKLATLANTDEKNKFVEHKLQVRDKSPRRCVEIGINIPKVSGYEPSIQYQITAKQNSPVVDKKFDPSHLLISDLSVLNVSDTVWVADCAGARECIPEFDLAIQTTIPDGYIIGSSNIESVSFIANNSGDVAYQACAQVITRDVHLGRWPSTCTINKNDVLVCQPRQPVEKNTQWQSDQIELDMKSLTSSVKSFTIAILIYPHCKPNETFIQTERTFIMQPDYKGLILKGSTKDTIDLTYEELMTSGKPTSHIYTVYNNGITLWVNLRCEIAIQKKYFYKDISVTVDSQSPYQCEAFVAKDGMYTTTCVIAALRRNHKFDVIIPINIEPGKIDADDLDDDNDEKVTLTSSLKLIYNDKQQENRIISTFKLKEAVVPIWIVIVAALVGLLIIIIIAFALYECGFLRRKNRDKLKDLRKSVHRQSIRRSMAVRDSLRASAAERRSGDREKLIGEKESDNDNTKTKESTELPKESTELQKKNTEIPKNEVDVLKVTDVPKNETGMTKNGTEMPKKEMEVPKRDPDLIDISPDPTKNDSNQQNDDIEIPSKVAEKCKIIKNEHIIRGLQKNLNRSLTHLAITPKDTKKDEDTEI